MNKKIRSCGVLLHPTSLPSRHGIGDLGSQAMRFVDFLEKSRVGLWQILPLGPVGYGNSPYASRSAFAGNELLIDLDALSADGLLDFSDVLSHPVFPSDRIDYGAVESWKIPLLSKAAGRFLDTAVGSQSWKSYLQYCQVHADWLEDYALYMELLHHYNDSRWFSVWDKGLANREPQSLRHAALEHERGMQVWKVLQYLFHIQWRSLRSYANSKGIRLVGDMPIYVAADSVDAWVNRKYLKINKDGNMTSVSGVPPDAFSETGQLWGNPVYDWNALAQDRFSWWVRRMEISLLYTDIIRIDHFRGFEACWEVPAGEETAENGAWIKGPGNALFEELHNRLGEVSVFAEDLGVITEEVEQLRDACGFPGMKVAQFAFVPTGGGNLEADNDYLPHNYDYHCVAYTGTHDNNTTHGWYDALDDASKDVVRRYLECADHEVVWKLMRAIMASHAEYVIFPMQDLLGLGENARMNTPGTCGLHNWSWRMDRDALSQGLSEVVAAQLGLFGRAI